MEQTTQSRTLRNLPLAVRLTLATFLVSVGLGYLSALVQVHFQHAEKGTALPSLDDVVRHFHGESSRELSSQLQHLLERTQPGLPFNGSGSMVGAFFKKSEDWDDEIKKRPEAELRKERDGERLALIDWIKDGAPKDEYEADKRPKPAECEKVTAKFLNEDGSVKIKSIVDTRCVWCHGKDGEVEKYPLATYPDIAKYTSVQTNPGQISITKLAQSTHAHLLSFSMLFMLTGLVFAWSSFPCWLRVVLSPWVLLAQMADIACWWLARMDGSVGIAFAKAITVTGGLVGLGLFLQIVLGLWDLFGRVGRVVLVALFLATGIGGLVVKQRVIQPWLELEKQAAAQVDGK